MTCADATNGYRLGTYWDMRSLAQAVSLGIRQIRAPDRPDLGIRCTASDRDGPCDTGVNGPPMARVVTNALCGLLDQQHESIICGD